MSTVLWLLGFGCGWLLLAMGLAVLIGRTIDIAEQIEIEEPRRRHLRVVRE
jgi:hypothetical protein